MQRKHRGRVPNLQDPIWEQSFLVALAHPTRWIEFRVKDNDVFGTQLIGVAKIPPAEVRTGRRSSDDSRSSVPATLRPNPSSNVSSESNSWLCLNMVKTSLEGGSPKACLNRLNQGALGVGKTSKRIVLVCYGATEILLSPQIASINIAAAISKM